VSGFGYDPVTMIYLEAILRILGSLGLFLYGMKIMSDGIQKTAGDRLQRVLNFMTGTRLASVLTGFGVTAIIQSSSATTVMVVSFVNAGLLTLTQSVGVIMGANIGTTVTAWIVSLVGFKMNIAALALPAIGLGFILMMAVKWGRRDLGEAILGFGILFLGLDFLTKSMPKVTPEALDFIASVSNLGFLTELIGVAVGMFVTILVHSSSASTAIILTLAFNGMINFPMAAAMVLGANIGTTIDAFLASIGTRAAARRAAWVHILFNVIGTVWAVALFVPFLKLIDLMTPGEPVGAGATTHLAMLHTVFNTINTILFFPFVNQFAALVTRMVKDDPTDLGAQEYKLVYVSASLQDTPELNIVRAEKEIRDMAGIVEAMFERFRTSLDKMEIADIEEAVAELRAKEDYADKMREELSRFLVECTRQNLNPKSERHVSHLLRIVGDLENMTDDCFALSLTLERSIVKKLHFNKKEVEALTPYVLLVRDFLAFVRANLGHKLSEEQLADASLLEQKIDEFRDKLKRIARKRLESGADVKTELLFIDLVRRIERLGDYAFSISEALGDIA
jgi:phosphate:Na+ symporter